jgi:hypothetical protein
MATPICGTPDEFVTCPEIDPDAAAAYTDADNINISASAHPEFRAILYHLPREEAGLICQESINCEIWPLGQPRINSMS